MTAPLLAAALQSLLPGHAAKISRREMTALGCGAVAVLAVDAALDERLHWRLLGSDAGEVLLSAPSGPHP